VSFSAADVSLGAALARADQRYILRRCVGSRWGE
jgi:hypothetical protein